MGGETFLNNNWDLRFNKIFIKVYVRQVFVNVRRNFISSRHYVQQVLKNYLQPWWLETKIILWSRQGGMLKFVNPKHKHRTENQSLDDSLSLNLLVYWAEINNSHAKIISFSLLISSHLFSRLIEKLFYIHIFKIFWHVFLTVCLIAPSYVEVFLLI